MALLQASWFSQSTKRNMSFHVLFPEGRTDAELRCAPVLVLLHGYAGNHFDWLLGSNIARYAQERGLVVVVPSGENHFYLDDDEREEFHSQWIVHELPKVISTMFGIAHVARRWYLGGYSMGGYGALRNALAYPGAYGGVIALSSALIVRGIAHLKPGGRTPYAGYGYYRSVFGDLETLVGSDRDPEALVARLKQSGGAFPRLYLACGTEDFLIGENRAFEQHLSAQGVAYQWVETPGGHDFDFWNGQLQPALAWMFEEKAAWT